PGLPLDDVQRLTAGFNLSLPNTSSWHTLIPTDVNALLANFPSGDSLGKPLGEPLSQIKSVFDHDFLSQFENVKSSLGGIAAPSTDSPEAFFDGLLAPLESISGLIQDPALKELFDLLGSILGLHELAQLPQTTA